MRNVRHWPMHMAMLDRRGTLGLVAALAGLGLGIVAVVLAVPVLAMAVAVCALVAGASSFLQARRIGDLERHMAPAGAGRLLDRPPGVQDESGELLDPETGLPDERFFDLALDARVALARRHLWPLTVMLVEIGLAPECEAEGPRSEALGDFAELLRRTLREADVVCRTSSTGFAMVLDDTCEEGGVWTAERLQVALSHDVSKIRRMAAGLASYPTHGLEACEVLARAHAALTRARASPAGRGLGQVEVALPDLA